MKARNLILLLIMVIFLNSCWKVIQPIEFEKVELTEENSKMNFKDFFRDMDFFELKFSNEEFWIGNIDSYKIVGDYIYLMDESQGKKIVKFDLQGNFIAEINSVNDAPEGFNSPYIFSVDEARNEMLVLDRSLLKLVYFDSNFNFIGSEKLDKYYSNIAHLKNGEGLLLFPDDLIKEPDGYVLAFKQTEGKLEPILHTKFPVIPFSMEPRFFNSHSRFFHLSLEEKLVRYEDNTGEFMPLFQVFFSEEGIPSKMLSTTDIYEVNSFIQESEKKCCTFNGMEYGDHYFFLYHRGLENHGIARVNRSDFRDNVSVSWNEMFSEVNVPVPYGSGDEFYYSVGYLSKDDYELVSKPFGKNASDVEFPDLKEKLFLFKFYLK
ncbi:6-bladed beta-propeller [Fontibacter flavus]|uniref:6-bladed beta-propeller n=1 Tax=Fontibacter flavus TaxID=654838 RepID=A0ABV6FYR0_9BACT